MSLRIHWVPGIPCNYLVFGTFLNRRTRRNAKKQPIVVEKVLAYIDGEEFLVFLCYFHLVISLAPIKFAKMFFRPSLNVPIMLVP